MPKRKAASRKKQDGTGGAKKPRCATASDGDQSLDSAVHRARLASHTVVQTLALVDAIQSTTGSFAQRMQAVADLLKEDADRSDSLIDLSLVAEGETVRLCIRTSGMSAASVPTPTGLH
jgi:hypothetical protein